MVVCPSSSTTSTVLWISTHVSIRSFILVYSKPNTNCKKMHFCSIPINTCMHSLSYILSLVFLWEERTPMCLCLSYHQQSLQYLQIPVLCKTVLLILVASLVYSKPNPKTECASNVSAVNIPLNSTYTINIAIHCMKIISMYLCPYQ